MIQNFKIINKKQLTKDVYEITYKPEKKINIKPGQFITFLIDKIGWRAYSILDIIDGNIVLIIKKWEIENGWRWWSKYLCEMQIWEELKWVGPAGHFILQENDDNKLFIGTWTWFVPLYNMFKNWLEKWLKAKFFFTFWIRHREDLFYLDQLKNLKDKYSNFDFAIYISREKDILDFELEHIDTRIYSWYTTNYLTPYNIRDTKEIYICWAPAMIESTQKKLKKIWFNEEKIFFEKY